MSNYSKIETEWQGLVFSLDLFNLYDKMILRELEFLLGFIISGYKHNLCDENDIMLLAASKGKRAQLLDRWKQGFTCEFKITECTVVSKRDNQRCKCGIKDSIIK